MALYGKKTGDVDIREYSQQGFVEKFAELSAFLKQTFGNDPQLETLELSLLTGNIMKYMEKWAGRHSPRPCPFTRIPAECLRDFSLEGPLACILKSCFEFKTQNSMPRINLEHDNEVQQNNEMFKHIIMQLRKGNFVESRYIYFSPDIDPQKVEELKEIARRHDAVVIGNQNSCTHIICNDYDQDESGEDFLRTLHVDKERKVAYVHWWYYPSSYDEWVPLQMVQGESEPEKQRTGPWKVGSRWLRDLAKYNEWLSELDYEIAEVPAEEYRPMEVEPVPEPQRKQSRKRNRDSEAWGLPSTKKVKNDKRKKQRSKFEGSMPNEIVDLNHGYQFNGNSTASITKPLYPVVVPAYANWFNQGMIHKIEWEEFKDILRGRTPKMTEMYVRVRDTIINTFRLNPRIHLTSTACRRLVTCDAGLCFRIHRFLENWNLINYHVDPGTIPVAEVEDIKPTHVETNLGIDIISRPHDQTETMSVESFVRPNERKVGETSHMKIGKKDLKCAISGKPLGESVFRCKFNPELVISPECMSKGALGGLKMSDFEHVLRDTECYSDEEEKMDEEGKVWSESDDQRLIEAISIYKDDWKEVANHCGRDVVDCMSHFVGLQLEETTISIKDLISPDSVSTFADGSNPIMRQAAFIAALVPPEIAAVAAQSAIRYKTQLESPSENTPEKAEFVPGAGVWTRYGSGAILEKGEQYKVQLDFGVAYLRESDLAHSQEEFENGRQTLPSAFQERKNEYQLNSLMKKFVTLELAKLQGKTKMLEGKFDILQKERFDTELCRQSLLKEQIDLTQLLLKVQNLMKKRQ